MFWLKKFVSFWLMPFSASITLLVVGVALSFTTRRQRLGRWLVAAGAAILLISGNKALSKRLIAPLEATYTALPELVVGAPLPPELAGVRAVVVLGGGHSDTAGLAAVNQLSPSAQARLVEAVRLLRFLPADARLIVCGRGPRNRPSHAAVLANAAASLGIRPERIVRLDTPRDTEDEAAELRRLLGDDRFALVTSAWHLPRAMALMHAAGLRPVPCPTDYSARPGEPFAWSDLLWDTDSIDRTTRVVHERLGRAWTRLRGRSD